MKWVELRCVFGYKSNLTVREALSLVIQMHPLSFLGELRNVCHRFWRSFGFLFLVAPCIAKYAGDAYVTERQCDSPILLDASFVEEYHIAINVHSLDFISAVNLKSPTIYLRVQESSFMMSTSWMFIDIAIAYYSYGHY